MATPYEKRRTAWIVCLVFSLVFAALACIFVFVLKAHVATKINEALVIDSKDHSGYDKWVDNFEGDQSPTYYSHFVYHLTNKDDFLAGKKPSFEERGPYVFKKHSVKQDVEFSGDFVTYNERDSYHYVPDMSKGSLDDKVTTVWPYYLPFLVPAGEAGIDMMLKAPAFGLVRPDKNFQFPNGQPTEAAAKTFFTALSTDANKVNQVLGYLLQMKGASTPAEQGQIMAKMMQEQALTQAEAAGILAWYSAATAAQLLTDPRLHMNQMKVIMHEWKSDPALNTGKLSTLKLNDPKVLAGFLMLAAKKDEASLQKSFGIGLAVAGEILQQSFNLDNSAIINTGEFIQERSIRNIMWGDLQSTEPLYAYAAAVGLNEAMTTDAPAPGFGGSNNTVSGPYKVNTGKSDIKQLTQYSVYNNYTAIPWVKPEQVQGTEGTQFYPMFDEGETLNVWSDDLKRVIHLVRSRDVEKYEIPLTRFKMSHSLLSCESEVEKAHCDNYDMRYTGLANMARLSAPSTPFNVGLPIALSKARFLDIDDELAGQWGGIEATIDDADTWLDVEPNTGTVMSAYQRLQINLLITKGAVFNYQHMNPDGKVKQSKYMKIASNGTLAFPLAWIEKHGEIKESQAKDFKSMVLDNLFYFSVGMIVSACLAGLLFITAIVLWNYNRTHKNSEDDQQTPLNPGQQASEEVRL
eukprot:GFYU01009262.1.p1 GENE.GFYU01009262.1~~GFYU01009262.1.p1  ORF type:complete len:689 (-),score=231.59 GFYU01009262.1:690-2756(-)